MLTVETYKKVMLENAEKAEKAIKEANEILDGPIIPGIVANDLRQARALGILLGTLGVIKISSEVYGGH